MTKRLDILLERPLMQPWMVLGSPFAQAVGCLDPCHLVQRSNLPTKVRSAAKSKHLSALVHHQARDCMGLTIASRDVPSSSEVLLIWRECVFVTYAGCSWDTVPTSGCQIKKACFTDCFNQVSSLSTRPAMHMWIVGLIIRCSSFSWSDKKEYEQGSMVVCLLQLPNGIYENRYNPERTGKSLGQIAMQTNTLFCSHWPEPCMVGYHGNLYSVHHRILLANICVPGIAI